MKWMIASDIHGSAAYCEKLLAAFGREQADRLLLLGDLLYHGPRNALPEEYDCPGAYEMLNTLKDRVLAVRGNCDSEVDQMILPFPMLADYALLSLEGVELFATHGHLFDPDHLPPLPAGSAFAFGHIHVKHAERQGDTLILNPGSVSIPKENSPHSYMTLEGNTMQWKELESSAVFHELTL